MTLRLRIAWYFSLLFFLVSPRAADFYRVEWSDDEPRHLVPRRGESTKHDRDIENTLSVTDTIARFIEVSAFGPERSLTVYVDVTKTSQEKYDGWGNVPEEE